MKKLLFLNPVHSPGTNLTVRKGTKWSLEKAADVQGVGQRRIRTKVVQFNTLEDEDLKFEHDPSCKTVVGLVDAMIKAYPDFKETDEVTLVFYYV